MMLTSRPYSSDYWGFGCILFQILAGRPPFQARTEYLMFQKIIKLEYEFPEGFPADARDLVEKLLVRPLLLLLLESTNFSKLLGPRPRRTIRRLLRRHRGDQAASVLLGGARNRLRNDLED